MKILMVLASGFPPDSRVEKEAISLLENGHEVHLACYLGHNDPIKEEKNYIKIFRMKASSFFINKLSALTLILPFYINKWISFIEKLHLQYNYDAIHIHDLPLSKVGYYFKKNYNLRLICDQHEFYSDWIKRTAHMNTFFGKIVLFFSDWESYERKFLKNADLVVTVAKPLEDNYIRKYSIDKEKIITIPNTPSKKIYNEESIDSRIVDKYKNDYVLFYAGGIDILRGIDTAILALKEIKTKLPNVKLVLSGRIIKPYDPFKTAKENSVIESMEFLGWIDEKLIPSYIYASKICFFVPPSDRDEINKTIPTKIYQYAVMGKPIIVSDATMMKDFVESNGLGISIPANDHHAFSDAVFKIYNNQISIKKINNKNLFWENTINPLIDKYKNL